MFRIHAVQGWADTIALNMPVEEFRETDPENFVIFEVVHLSSPSNNLLCSVSPALLQYGQLGLKIDEIFSNQQ
ncbi:hypothetical protein TK90_1101 [Thioalkalivibrio sp. K90mix]|nr:hypothetical protein TK90_1101 [Thioalkalivibrio sp. K90mix]